MEFFKRKATPIEAVQYTGKYQELVDFCPLIWVRGNPVEVYFSLGISTAPPSASMLPGTGSTATFSNPTEAHKRVHFGDWVVKEGESFRVYTSTEFNKNFEKNG